MDRIRIEDVARHAGEEIEIAGWLYHRSSKGKLHFLQVRDGSGIIQCVLYKGDVSPEMFAAADHLTQESSLLVRGVVKPDPRSPLGFELGVKELLVVSIAAEYPITPKEHGTAFLMENRHLWIRSRRQHAALRIRHELQSQARRYLDDQGFLLLDAPILTPAACEGTTTLFPTDYFGEPAFLTQSGQLYGEATAMAFGKVYCFGPCFRAEKSKTRRHLTEFWMIEPEIAFCDLQGDMDLAEDLIEQMVQRTIEKRGPELAVLERDVAKLEKIRKPFPRISYEEALDLLRKNGRELAFGDDLGAEDETLLGNSFEQPVMIHRYPSAIKAFYMKHDPERPELALCVDVLAPEGYGEIVGGGQREDDLQKLEDRIAAHGLPREAFAWYLDLRRYGSVPHAGFGLGLERVVAWVCGLSHVRETTPFPRMLGKIWP